MTVGRCDRWKVLDSSSDIKDTADSSIYSVTFLLLEQSPEWRFADNSCNWVGYFSEGTCILFADHLDSKGKTHERAVGKHDGSLERVSRAKGGGWYGSGAALGGVGSETHPTPANHGSNQGVRGNGELIEKAS